MSVPAAEQTSPLTQAVSRHSDAHSPPPNHQCYYSYYYYYYCVLFHHLQLSPPALCAPWRVHDFITSNATNTINTRLILIIMCKYLRFN